MNSGVICLPSSGETISLRASAANIIFISSFFNSAKEIDSNFNEEVFNIIYTPLVDISDDGTSYINQIMISPLTQFINTHILGYNHDR